MAAVALHAPHAFNARHHHSAHSAHHTNPIPSSSSSSGASTAIGMPSSSSSSSSHHHHSASHGQHQSQSHHPSGSGSSAPSSSSTAGGSLVSSSANPASSSTPLRRAYNIRKGNSSSSSSNPQPTSSASAAAVAHPHDSYYGHEDAAKTCARFVSCTFGCPEILPPPPQQQQSSSGSSSVPSSSGPNVPGTLAHFIAYALHRTRLPPSVTFTALALLHRLKTRFPHARGSSGHRLFLSAFMLASKVVCDDTYSNKSWAVVGQGMFALREINQMEREMCGYLEWQLNVPREDLEAFEAEVRRIYGVRASTQAQQGGLTILLNNGVGGKPLVSSVPTMQPPPVPSVSSPTSAPPVPEKPSKDALTSPQQLPTPTEGGATQIPFSSRNGGSQVPIYPVPMHQQQHQQQQQRKMPYPSPPTTPPSPSVSSSARTLSRASQSTIQVQRPIVTFPAPQPQYIIPITKSDIVDDDADSEDSDSDCCDSDDDGEHEHRQGEEDPERRLTDSPSPTPSSSTSASTASDGSLRTPPSAKQPPTSYPPHHAHNASYGGLVKSYSLPPHHLHSANGGSGNVQRSQTLPSSEFAVTVPAHHLHQQRGGQFVWQGSNNGSSMNVDTSNGSEAEYVGAPVSVSAVVSVASATANGKKMQAMMMPRTFTVPCSW